MILVELSLSVWHRHSWAQLGMWPTLAISQSGDNQQKQLVLIGLILQTPSADNSAKYSRNQKSARDPEWQGEYSAIHAGQNINKIKCLLLLSFEYLDKTRMGWCPRTGGGQRLMRRTVINVLMCWQHAKINTPNK